MGQEGNPLFLDECHQFRLLVLYASSGQVSQSLNTSPGFKSASALNAGDDIKTKHKRSHLVIGLIQLSNNTETC